jgi:hypothetical protein
LLLNETADTPSGQKHGAATEVQGAGSNAAVVIALRADTGNRFGIGARVGVVQKDETILWRRARTDGSYLSASDGRVHVGLGRLGALHAVVVEWPDGPVERFTPASSDISLVTLRRGAGLRTSTALP